MKTSILGDIKKKTREILALSEEKFTPLRMEKELIKEFVDKKVVQKAMREMILQGELCYTNIYGSSFIERSINRLMPISNHVVLVPAGMSMGCNSNRVTIRIVQGGSFGNGHHPTTRISIRGIDFAMSRGTFGEQDLETGALDIGTGSGVLAIAAVRLGMKKAIGMDIDAIARKEASENIEVNGLTEQIKIVDTEINMISGRFSLISANLRTPTLKQMVPYIIRMLVSSGVLVISGFRMEEILFIREIYEREGFNCIWEESETGWSGLVLERCAL